MKILVTGAAGFIGYHVCKHLLDENHIVVGVDNLNDYYDISLKKDRLKNLGIEPEIKYNTIEKSKTYYNSFFFIKLNIEDRENIPNVFRLFKFDCVCNLAAQAGVRYSIESPFTYIDSNIYGFLNLLEACRHNNIEKFVYASSSSVYGDTVETPFSISNNTDKPVSLYAATKKSNELIAHTYSDLFNIKTIGLRFFTVYGPWGRPDMAMFLFTDSIINSKKLKVFNNGELARDFTYIDDIAKGVVLAITKDPKINNSLYNLYNIGNGQPINILSIIEQLESCLGKRAIKEFLPMQLGDVKETWADTSSFENDFNFYPKTNYKEGVQFFVDWYQEYYSK